jgi:hypothetical protein
MRWMSRRFVVYSAESIAIDEIVRSGGGAVMKGDDGEVDLKPE